MVSVKTFSKIFHWNMPTDILRSRAKDQNRKRIQMRAPNTQTHEQVSEHVCSSIQPNARSPAHSAAIARTMSIVHLDRRENVGAAERLYAVHSP